MTRLILAAVSAAAFCLFASPSLAYTIFVSNEKDNTITVLNGDTLETIKTIKVSRRPRGIILSPDEKTLYVTNGGVVVAFDVRGDGSLANQREFAKLRGGQGGDGATVDSEGRLYASTGSSVDIFAPDGRFLGSIAGPTMLHGVAFGGTDKKTLYAIVFYGGWGTASARNRIIAIPTIAQGYTGRAK